MSRKPDNVFKLSETLTLCEYEAGRDKGFWLYDKTRGMNLAMRSKTDTDAFVSALAYYQNRLTKVETSYRELKTNVDEFVERFAEDHS
jgi:hypothetical protein